jgi:hypothetical protein
MLKRSIVKAEILAAFLAIDNARVGNGFLPGKNHEEGLSKIKRECRLEIGGLFDRAG